MKSLDSSDIKSTAVTIMNHAAFSLAPPVSTALIWGCHGLAAASTATWEPGAIRRQDFTAIWGTLGIPAPAQYETD